MIHQYVKIFVLIKDVVTVMLMPNVFLLRVMVNLFLNINASANLDMSVMELIVVLYNVILVLNVLQIIIMVFALMGYVVVNTTMDLSGSLIKSPYLKIMLVNVLLMKLFIGTMEYRNVFLLVAVEKYGNVLKLPLNLPVLLALNMEVMY
ncbi:putative ORFan [Cotonvirus japonicus]|uniref:ORFan n=1 Tax=Cotonvirus japonicus TaxID=2811091 RepID=A0ABM7NTW5_9VIRU|nr:putative ORFan [Cotonvirus japonicus]BCS83618.1 putative ORFan [Cotonvirus japonicus]